MANPPQIVDITEIISYMGIETTTTDAQRGRLEMLRQMVENDCRRFVRHGITQPTTAYTHFLPDRKLFSEESELIDVNSDHRVLFGSGISATDELVLPQSFVRSITSVYVDRAAYGGQAGSAFAASTLLTSGTDYWLDVDESGLSRSGILYHISGSWPSSPRTVKVTYVAGLTAAELDNDYSDLKLAVIQEVANVWQMAQTQGHGRVQSESLGGEYSVTYEKGAMGYGGLSDYAKSRLLPLMRMAL